jgi:hypothetical protein
MFGLSKLHEFRARRRQKGRRRQQKTRHDRFLSSAFRIVPFVHGAQILGASRSTNRLIRDRIRSIRRDDGKGIREDGSEDIPTLVSSGCGRTARRDPGFARRNRTDHAILQSVEGDGCGVSHLERVCTREKGVQPPKRESQGSRPVDPCPRRFRPSYGRGDGTRAIRGLHRSTRTGERFGRTRFGPRVRIDARQQEDASTRAKASLGAGQSTRATRRAERRKRSCNRVRYDFGSRRDGRRNAQTCNGTKDQETHGRVAECGDRLDPIEKAGAGTWRRRKTPRKSNRRTTTNR